MIMTGKEAAKLMNDWQSVRCYLTNSEVKDLINFLKEMTDFLSMMKEASVTYNYRVQIESLERMLEARK